MSDGASHGYREANPIKDNGVNHGTEIPVTYKTVPHNPMTKTLMQQAPKQNLKDGGTRKTYNTGAQKEDDDATEGKGAFHLLPPTAIRRVAEIWRKGAKKYAARNWEKGLPLSRLLDSGLRHAFQYLEGMQDEDHLAQATWNFLALLHTEEMIKRGILPNELADLPSYRPRQESPELWRQKENIEDKK